MRTDISHLTHQEQKSLRVFIQKLREQLDDQMLSVLLFGSRARGEAHPDSDIDVAVIVEQNDPKISKAIRYLAVEVWLEYGLYLSTCVWSRTHWQQLQTLQTRLYRNIQQEGVDLLQSKTM